MFRYFVSYGYSMPQKTESPVLVGIGNRVVDLPDLIVSEHDIRELEQYIYKNTLLDERYFVTVLNIVLLSHSMINGV